MTTIATPIWLVYEATRTMLNLLKGHPLRLRKRRTKRGRVKVTVDLEAPWLGLTNLADIARDDIIPAARQLASAVYAHDLHVLRRRSAQNTPHLTYVTAQSERYGVCVVAYPLGIGAKWRLELEGLRG